MHTTRTPATSPPGAEEGALTNLQTVARLPASSADRARNRRTEPEENGVHIRGLLLHAGSAAHGGTYLFRYLARKYTFSPKSPVTLSG